MLKKRAVLFLVLLSFGPNASCKKNSSDDDKAGVDPGIGAVGLYADPIRWLCLPGRDDSCSSSVAVSEIHADGSFKAVDPQQDLDDSVDCFYVHPTSDLSIKPGNSENFEYLEPVEQLAKMQIVPFKGTCRIFAPLYHQITIGTYALPEEERKPYVERAAADIREAFDHYMTNYNAGRKFVLIGHSQGSEMLSILLKEIFDPNPALRSQLLLAILPGFAIHVPVGETVGGTFSDIPACTTAYEQGCVISFRSYKGGTNYLGDGSISLFERKEELCVNPATLDDMTLTVEERRSARVPLKGTLLPPANWVKNSTRLLKSATPFVLADSAYSAACASGPDPRNRFLSIEENLPLSDARYGLVLLDSKALSGITGLHTLDMQFPMAELVALVRARH